MGCGASKQNEQAVSDPNAPPPRGQQKPKPKPQEPKPKPEQPKPKPVEPKPKPQPEPKPITRPVPKPTGPPADGGKVPYGEWGSVITADDIAASSVALKTTLVYKGIKYWLESRPSEKGRYVVCREGSDGKPEDVLPSPFSARSIVYNYGGGPFCVSSEKVYFANYAPANSDDDENDYRIYGVGLDGKKKPRAVTKTKNMRYGNLVYDRKNRRILAVREDWNGVTDPTLPLVTIVSIDPKTGVETVVVQGADMYFVGEVNDAGTLFSFISWNYPNMPWDGTQLYVVNLDKNGNREGKPLFISGGKSTSIMEPRFGPDGWLYYISDSTGRWNFKRCKVDEASVSYETLTELSDAEFGAPQWGMGSRVYGFTGKDVIAARCTKGLFDVVSISTKAPHNITPLDLADKSGHPFTAVSAISCASDAVVLIAGNNFTPSAVLDYNIKKKKQIILRSAHELKDGVQAYISTAEAIEFPTSDGSGKAYAFYYPATNPKYQGPDGEKAPLIIRSHGGPSAAASSALDLNIHYFTSRGLSLVDVNYRGSSGYGREYLTSLYGYWGIKDPEDCLAAADYLAKRGDIDPKRLVAEGGSAGGYCTNVLATYYDKLAAGASFYGISNLLQLAKMTGNYERHYIDQLVGPLPESEKTYKERSPLYHVTNPDKPVTLKTPVIFFQGTDDHVVPPEQTKAIFETLVTKKIPTAEMLFEGEQHGFRDGKNIKASLWGEEYFLGQMLNYVPHDRDLPKIDIKNWPA